MPQYFIHDYFLYGHNSKYKDDDNGNLMGYNTYFIIHTYKIYEKVSIFIKMDCLPYCKLYSSLYVIINFHMIE